MNFKRIISCLDLFNGRIIKGINFKNLVDIGDPIDIVKYYTDEGCDEIVILDVSASIENKKQKYNFINKISIKTNIPITVGGGINCCEDFEYLFNSGADKIALNSHIISNFEFIENIKFKYGSQCLVASLDVKRFTFNEEFYFWNIYKKSGKHVTGFNLYDLVLKFLNLGVGEFIITSIDRDGTKKGYDNELINKISNLINNSVIVSGGGGNLKSLLYILKNKNVNSILLASVLHNKNYNIFDIKNFLFNNGLLVRI